jgi:hypothetical protein
MNDNQAEKAIQLAGMTAPRILPEDINRLAGQLLFIIVQPAGTTSTFVHAYLPGTDGKKFYLATGHAACVSPENFNAQIGEGIAQSKAVVLAKDKLWELEGYALFKEMNRAH